MNFQSLNICILELERCNKCVLHWDASLVSSKERERVRERSLLAHSRKIHKHVCCSRRAQEYEVERQKWSFGLSKVYFISEKWELNHMHSLKQWLLNRAAQFRKSDSYAGLESQNLSIFLATNDIIRSNLKRALDDADRGVPGYEEILCDVINTSAQMFENKLYLLPQEKHILVKVGRIFCCHEILC